MHIHSKFETASITDIKRNLKLILKDCVQILKKMFLYKHIKLALIISKEQRKYKLKSLEVAYRKPGER